MTRGELGSRRLGRVGATTGAALLVASAVAIAQPASAAYRGQAGAIAFTSSRTGSTQVYLRASDGTERQLTKRPGGAAQPTFSPDGTKIAYASGGDIWVMGADGSHQVNLTRNKRDNAFPTWSPDGTKIAFSSTRDVVLGEIYTMPAGGGAAHRVTRNTVAERDLAWSPDGKSIAFDASTPNQQVSVVTVASGAVKDLSANTSNDSNPDWSPDGRSIVFVSDRTAGGNLWRMNANGSAQAAIGTPNPYTGPVAPAWSPDGKHVLVGANMGMGSLQLWSVDPATGIGTQLTADSGNPVNAWPDEQPLHVTSVGVSKPSGAAGAKVTVSGSDFLSVQTVKVAFVDKAGHSYPLASPKTSVAGRFSAIVTVPAAAAKGPGRITATGLGGLSASVAFSKP